MIPRGFTASRRFMADCRVMASRRVRAGGWLVGGLAAMAISASTAAAQPSDADRAVEAIFAEEWAFRLRENPLLATAVGDHRYNDRLPQARAKDQARRAEVQADLLARLEGVDRNALNSSNRVSYDMLAVQLRDAMTQFDFRTYENPLTADSGFHTEFARMPSEVPLANARDYENYIARMNAWPAHVNQQIEVMRSGLRRGFTAPRVVLVGYESTISGHVLDDHEESVFWAPFESFPSGLPPDQYEALRAAGQKAIQESVIPGYRRFFEFMTDEYLPNTRTSLGASDLPQGAEYYEFLIEHFTTLEMTPKEIHELGLSEVARIRTEMDAIIEEVGFDGSFEDFLEFLRTDPQFYAQTPEELLEEALVLAKVMDGRLPALFKTLPRMPYTVAPVPDEIAPKYTTGRYVNAPRGGTQPGYYWVNTYKLEIRPLYALPALTLHEAVPGHHLQISLADELEDLPQFRRVAYVTAFGEGWGLYSEWLGIEAGMYTTPYTRFGRLTYEMWRACRLVVDTGVHAMGWTRQHVMDYMAANTALPLHEITTETDRYIAWPGQALAYKLGELKIRELRTIAETELGAAFDVREFHDAVLGNGTVPLTVLEDQVREYIERSR